MEVNPRLVDKDTYRMATEVWTKVGEWKSNEAYNRICYSSVMRSTAVYGVLEMWELLSSGGWINIKD